MLRRTMLSIPAIAWMLVGTSGLAAAQRVDETMELKLELLTDKKVFAPGESIPFRLELVNLGSSPARTISLGTNGRATRVIVKQKSGETVFSLCRDEATYGRRQTVTVPGIDPRIELEPGESDQATFDVQAMQLLNEPGRYALSATHGYDDVELASGVFEFEIRTAQVDAASIHWSWVDAAPATLRVLLRDLGIWQLRRTTRRSPDFIESSYPVPSIPRDADVQLPPVSAYDTRDRDALLWAQSGGLHVQVVQGGHAEPVVVAPLPSKDWELLSACAHAENDDVTAAFIRGDAAGRVVARGRFDAAGARQAWDELALDRTQTTNLVAGMTAAGELYVAWTKYNSDRDETTAMVRPVSASRAEPRGVGTVHGAVVALRFLPGAGGEELRLALLTRSVQRDDVLRYGVFDPMAAQTLSPERALSLDAKQPRLRQWEIDEEGGLIVLFESEGRLRYAHVEGPRGDALPKGVVAQPPMLMVVAPDGYVFCLANAGARGLVAYPMLTPPSDEE